MHKNHIDATETLDGINRVRRTTSFTSPRGRYRGQTQSQYLAIDRGNNKDEGKAEAHSAADSSRATVSKYNSRDMYETICNQTTT